MKFRYQFFLISLLGAISYFVSGECSPVRVIDLKLRDSEKLALKNSNFLESFQAMEDAANEQADSLIGGLMPRITFEAGYTYLSQVANLPLPTGTFPINSHDNYSIGPVLRYTLWDTGSARNAYLGSKRNSEARQEDRKNAEIQLLYSVRSSYGRVLLALEELRLVADTLALARAQERDVVSRYKVGAAARLDRIISHRQVLSYELQFKQKRAELSLSLKDLFAILGEEEFLRLSKFTNQIGPEGLDLPEISIALRVDPIDVLLKGMSEFAVPPPDEEQSQIKTQRLSAESSELSAHSQMEHLYPTIQLMLKSSLDYPNGPLLQQINQNTVGLTLSMPLFESSQTRHRVAQLYKEAEASHFREKQTRLDMQRGFAKAQELLESLREQQRLAVEDILRSEEEAKLYYDNYKAGRSNLIDVQSANVQALESKVNGARIDAQILNQLIALIALSGKELK